MRGQADGIAGDLIGAGGAVPLADRHAGLGEAGEELLLAARPGRRGAHLPAQPDPRRLTPAAARRLFRLGPGRAPGRGAIRRSSTPQPEPRLSVLARFPHPVEVVPDPRPGPVLAGQRGHDVHVVSGVTDRDPPHAQVIARRRQPGAVHDLRRDLRPLRVRQQPVLWRGADGAVPHRLGIPRAGQRGQRLGQQPGQAAEVA